MVVADGIKRCQKGAGGAILSSAPRPIHPPSPPATAPPMASPWPTPEGAAGPRAEVAAAVGGASESAK